jgi:phage replication-related protein YjqB (UPF0714/DUF867 family)
MTKDAFNRKKTKSDTYAFMRELIEEILSEQKTLLEYEGVDIGMFAKWGHIADVLFKAEYSGELEKTYSELVEKLSGSAAKALVYFYDFIKKHRDRIHEDKIKGADGKVCWKGYRYAGTENGKDKCIRVKK